MTKTIHLIRHGQSTFNAAFEATGEDPFHPDARLSDLGLEQVRAARQALAALSVELVVTSPLTRAIQTCDGIFGHRGLPMRVEALHRECRVCSCDQGRSPRELAAEFPHLDFAHLDDPWWHVDPAGGIEPHETLLERVAAFRGWLAARPERCIAVVGHGTFFFHLAGRQMLNCERVELIL